MDITENTADSLLIHKESSCIAKAILLPRISTQDELSEFNEWFGMDLISFHALKS